MALNFAGHPEIALFTRVGVASSLPFFMAARIVLTISSVTSSGSVVIAALVAAGVGAGRVMLVCAGIFARIRLKNCRSLFRRPGLGAPPLLLPLPLLPGPLPPPTPLALLLPHMPLVPRFGIFAFRTRRAAARSSFTLCSVFDISRACVALGGLLLPPPTPLPLLLPSGTVGNLRLSGLILVAFIFIIVVDVFRGSKASINFCV
jgi:hypothetical protein